MTEYIHPQSLLLGALPGVLPLLAGLLLQRRANQNALSALHEQLKSLLESSTVQATELRGVRQAHEERIADIHRGHDAQLTESREESGRQLDALKGAHERAIAEARAEMSIVTYPYASTQGDDGWIVDDRIAEVGYQYQLFLRGIPCFEPHRVILQRVERKEVNPEKLASLKEDITGLLTTIASKHPAFQVAAAQKALQKAVPVK